MPRRSSILFDTLPPCFSAPLAAYKNYFFGEPELRTLRNVVPAEGLSIDVGAHHGVYTFFLSRCSDRVVAYEPNPELATYLRRSVRHNVTVRDVALGETAGAGFLAIPFVDGIMVPGWAKVVETADHAPQTYKIAIVRLDDEHLRNVGFIKIDVEGNEEAVLRGGIETIRRDFPVLLIEIEKRHLARPMSEMFALVEEMGYRGFFLVDRAWRPIAQFEAVLRSDRDRADMNSSRYLNNFLFWPKARGNPPW